MLRHGAFPYLLALSFGWYAVALTIGRPLQMGAVCGSLGLDLINGSLSIWALTVSPGQIALAWLVMLLAMMPLGLAMPVQHVRLSSFPARRARATSWFAAGYLSIWLCAGVILIPAAALLSASFSGPFQPVLGIGFALAWSCSPIAQTARNACHRLVPISPFGFRADMDCFLQGLTTSVACVATCWPWMLATLLWGELHMLAMAMTAAILFADRSMPPVPPRWRVPAWASVARALIGTRQKVRGRL